MLIWSKAFFRDIMSRKFIQLILCLSLLSGSTVVAVAAEKPIVFVSIQPQKYFVEQLAGDAVEVEVMVPPGASPATYEPRPSQMIKLARAKIYYSIGVPFEASWLPRLQAVAPEITLVATDAGIVKRAIDFHPHHGADSGHTIDRRAIADPHIWLSPPLVRQQAEHIARSLQSLLPARAEETGKRFSLFVEKLERLNSSLHQIFQGREGVHFMVFHPSWGYFADEYGLIQEPVEFAGKSPKPAQLAELVRMARADGIETILVQPQFSRKSAELVAREIGGKVVIADPLAVDWEENLKQVSRLIIRAAEK